MMFGTHVALGAAAGLAYGIHYGKSLTVTIPLSILGGIFPDTDHEKSIPGQFLPLWTIFKHREFTHSIECGLLISAPLWYFGSITGAIAFAIGFGTHIFADLFNKKPVLVSWLLQARLCFYTMTANGIGAALVKVGAIFYIVSEGLKLIGLPLPSLMEFIPTF